MTEAIPTRSAGQLKQDLIRVYNAVNQEISGIGVSQQRVELLGDRILFVAQHQRIPALAALDRTNPVAARAADVAIIDDSKTRLRAAVESLLGVPVRAVLKDYDPGTELAVTLVVLATPLAG